MVFCDMPRSMCTACGNEYWVQKEMSMQREQISSLVLQLYLEKVVR